MALGDPYAAGAELKLRLGIEDDTEDTRIATALAVATSGINGFCRRQFNKAGSVSARVFTPTDRCFTVVDDFFTTTGLVVKSDEDGDGVYETTWAATDYQLEPLNGIVDAEPGWPYWIIRAVGSRRFPRHHRERAALQTTAQWGWDEVPDSIHEATLVLAEDIFKLGSLPFGAGGYGEFGRMRARDNPHVVMLAGKYRIHTAGV